MNLADALALPEKNDVTAALKLYRHGVEFSPDQQRAIDAIDKWRDSWPSGKQYFTMAGYAGCGKTAVASEWIKGRHGVSVVAPTGKAVNRLKQGGVAGATTIHGLIYIPFDVEEEDKKGRTVLKTRFKRRDTLENVSTIVCDEASMVDQFIMNDLLAYGIPVLFVGDHGQLQPIGKDPEIMKHPDVTLEKIHRQAENNPILRLAAAFREGREHHVWQSLDRLGRWESKCGKVLVTTKAEFENYASSGMQLICGFNKTRHRLNQLARHARDFGGETPCPGETIICLKNNKEFGIFNGQQAQVVEAYKPRRNRIELEIQLDDGSKTVVTARVDQFGRNTIEDHRNNDVALYDFAYCVSAHKSQGSEWPGVVVLDEVHPSWNPRRWRYTSVTRAKERLIYCV